MQCVKDELIIPSTKRVESSKLSEREMVLQLLFQILCCVSVATSAAAAADDELKPNCPSKCGNVSIPYPFGIGDRSCYRDNFFMLTCINDAERNEQKPFFGELEVLDISLEGQMTVRRSIGWDCYTKDGNSASQKSYQTNLYEMGPYTYSNTRNKFTAVGCDTKAYVTGSWGRDFISGCISYCKDEASVIDGSCSGIGCCQSSIPAGVKKFDVTFESFRNHTQVWEFNRCSYSFLADGNQFNFSSSDLHEYNLKNRKVPVVLDWVVGNETCEKARANKTTYACLSENSKCYFFTDGPGYRCNCSSGYQGNPYIQRGCQDIDECHDQTSNPCSGDCTNTEGSYFCTCPKNTRRNPYKEGCIEDTKEFPAFKVFLGVGLSLLLLFVAATWIYWALKKRKMIKLKEKFFQQNGGLLLQQKISPWTTESFKIFTTEELERATESYSVGRIIGRGGYGVVYKGTLPDNRTIAIKKSKTIDASQIEQFINEVAILSQINHRNVVKLLGCCLEDQVPLLVYEFVSNGTLYSHIHKMSYTRTISLQNRLRIAIEIAEALAYLHSAASIPIFHRDVKSSNILLDDNLTAKVSDFGASRLVPIDQTKITTLVKGTLGYLDPEYFQTGQLTAKSDVYSFGVVLAELLTGEEPVCLTKSEEERNLAMCFICAMRENRLPHILDDKVLEEGQEAQLMAIARLAVRCLNLKGEERPTMKEIVVELQGIKETQSLLGGTSHLKCTSEAGGHNS
ncbi:putative wall-associated receptor kinase-like protein 16 [Cinnamomum micranthum f. kanehirae]|uniref:Putative wall-associated receptor kinase-like protein 16 n=1 Tax=Cinnamomum micranthum f. kanehirae TaxID=337451 RepID=A0A3S3MTM3_9MAGN|nr:putative wall-associated receptor kinase-like protein 16 [Cinnamomum micranthum f. kanehirae]